MEIVELMLELGASDYNWTMTAAALEGHKEIVERMLQLGANAYNSAMTVAVREGHDEIVALIKSYTKK
jgi:hypothetical protein